MSNPTPAPNVIPRAQWAAFVRDPDGVPMDKVIQDLEAQQQAVTTTIPSDVAAAAAAAAAAQVTANTALANAATAQGTASGAAGLLNGDSFLTVNAEASLPQSRRMAVGLGLQKTDGGAGNALTLALSDIVAILPADVSDATAAFVNATGLLAALAINSTYIVEALLTYQSTLAGQGIGLGFTLPAGATISGGYFHNVTPTTNQSAYNNAAGAVSGNTTATPIANTNTPIIGRWIIKTAGTAGNAQLQLRTSNVLATATLKQDLSTLIFRKIV